jgi:hypothetical protein
MDTLTQSDVLNLLNTGHVVAAYPRKKLIVVNGFKRYRATPAALRAAKSK